MRELDDDSVADPDVDRVELWVKVESGVGDSVRLDETEVDAEIDIDGESDSVAETDSEAVPLNEPEKEREFD